MNLDFDFQKLKNRVVKTAHKVKKVSENTFEITKFKCKLSDINSKIYDKYIQIGKIVYESDPECEIGDKLKTICDEITKLKSEASNITDSIDSLSNKKRCSECDYTFARKYEFCPKCGKKFDD